MLQGVGEARRATFAANVQAHQDEPEESNFLTVNLT